MSKNSDNSSTVGAMLQNVAGAVQSGLGQLTGSGKDVKEGETRKVAAQEQNETSHTAAKLGPITATGEGGGHVDNKDRQQGAFDQTIGSGKQFVGGVIGSESLKAQGREQYDRGVQRETAGQASDLVEGISKRVGGTLGNIGAAVTGDTEAQRTYQQQHAEGKAAQRSVEHDLQKKAEAQERRGPNN